MVHDKVVGAQSSVPAAHLGSPAESSEGEVAEVFVVPGEMMLMSGCPATEDLLALVKVVLELDHRPQAAGTKVHRLSWLKDEKTVSLTRAERIDLEIVVV